MIGRAPQWKAAEAMAALLRRFQAIAHVAAFSSFNHAAMDELAILLPRVPRALLFNHGGKTRPGPLPENLCEMAVQRGAAEVHVRSALVTKPFVDHAHSTGLRVMAWFPGSHKANFADHLALAQSGVDAVCTNQPLKALYARRAFEKHTAW